MSKRAAPVQGGKQDTGFRGDGSDSVEMDQAPRRATAAQLANRKLKQLPKSRLRSTTNSPARPLLGQSLPPGSGINGTSKGDAPIASGLASQQNLPAFNYTPSQAGNPFGAPTASQSFPSINGVGPQDNTNTSASFPAFNGASGNGNGGGFNFASVAPDSGFTFSSSAQGFNPFASINGPQHTTTPAQESNPNSFNAFNFSTTPSQPEKPFNFFGQSTNTASVPLNSQTAPNGFGKVPSPSVNDDTMHTSPDRSSTKTNAGLFSFATTSQPNSSPSTLFTQPSTSNLIHAPTSTVANQPVLNLFGPTPPVQSQMANPFQISKTKASLDSTASTTNTLASPSPSGLSAPITTSSNPRAGQANNLANLFFGVNSNTSVISDKPVKSSSGLFGEIARKPTSTAGTTEPVSKLSAAAPSKPAAENVKLVNIPSSATTLGSNLKTFSQTSSQLSGNNTNTVTGLPVKFDSQLSNYFTNPAPSNENLVDGPENRSLTATNHVKIPVVSTTSSSPPIQTQVEGRHATVPVKADKGIIDAAEASRLLGLNLSLRSYLVSQDDSTDWSPILLYYIEQVANIHGSAIERPSKPQGEPSLIDANRSSLMTAMSSKTYGFDTSQGQASAPGTLGGSNHTTLKRKAGGDQAEEGSEGGVGGKRQMKASQPFGNSFSSTVSTNTVGNTSETSNLFRSLLEKPTPSDITHTAFGQQLESRQNHVKAGPQQSILQSNTVSSEKSIKRPSHTNLEPSSSMPTSIFGLHSQQAKPTDTSKVAQPSTATTAAGFLPKTSFSAQALPSSNSFSMFNSAANASKPAFELPKFAMPSSDTNFLGQFTKLAEIEEKKEKEKRKAEDFDSEEEDEAEWERKDAKIQQAKKAKINEEMKALTANKPQFINGKFTLVKEDEPATTIASETLPTVHGSLEDHVSSKEGSSFRSRDGSPAASTASKASVFDSPRLGPTSALTPDNIFAHLSDAESGTDGRKDVSGQSSEPQSENDFEDDTREPFLSSDSSKSNSRSAAPGEQRGLFSRINVHTDGSPQLETVPDLKINESQANNEGRENNTGTTSAIKSSSLTKRSAELPHDRTWKTDSPIKFGTTTPNPLTSKGSTPAFVFTPLTSSKPANFGANDTASKPQPFANLFGSNLFGVGNKATSGFGNPESTPRSLKDNASSIGEGFSFATPKPTSGSLFPTFGNASQNQNQNQNATSRSSTPGFTTDAGESADSNVEGEGPPPSDPQIRDLTALSEDEVRDEQVLFDGSKVRAMKHEPGLKNQAGIKGDGGHLSKNAAWVNKGIGPIRVLKHRTTGAARILMRAAPSGTIIINSRLLSRLAYTKPQGKTAQVVLPNENGQLSTWMIRFGKEEDASKFVETCEEHKA